MKKSSLLIINGHVQTMDDKSSTAEAIFIEGNIIQAVGSNTPNVEVAERGYSGDFS